MKVSIIVPIYKVENYIDKCIESIVEQTYKNLEIILVDDGSPDKCPQICDEWAIKDKRIKVIHKKNGGVMQAWIDGVNLSTSEYVTFVDGDDWIEKNFVERLISPILKNPLIEITICNFYKVQGAKKDECSSFSDKRVGILSGDEYEFIKKNKLGDFLFYRWNKLFKKSLIAASIAYCDTRVKLWDDVCSTASCLLDAKTIYFVDDPLYNYNQRQNSIVHTIDSEMDENFAIFYNKYEQLLSDKNYRSDQNFATILSSILFILARKIVLSGDKKKRTKYRNLYKSKFYTELKKYKTTQIPKLNKLFLIIFNLRNYFIMKVAINIFLNNKNKRK